jgi:hypothetical protein
MLTTSSAYKTAIAASSRQIKSRCAIAYTYPFIHAKISSVASSTEHADSDRAKVVEGLGLGDYYNAGKYRGFKNNAASDSDAAYATNACYLQVNYIANEILTRMELVGDLQGEITVTNLAVNGGFEDGVLAPFTCDRTATITDGIASFTATSQYDSLNYAQPGVDGAKYAYIAKVKTSAPSIRLANNWGGMSHTGGGDWEMLSFVGTLSASTDAGVEIIDLDASTHGLVEVDYIMIIPLTDEIGTDYFLNLKYKAMDYFSVPQTVQIYETPVDYTIKYLNSADGVIATTTVTDNYELKKINAVSTALTTIRKVRLDVTKWSRASVSAKISGFSPRTVVNYDGNQIMTIEVNEEIETEQGTVFGTAIAKQCSIVFNNIEGDFDSIDKLAQRAFYPEIGSVLADGTIEYEPMGTYYTDEWRFDDDRLTLNVSGLDIIGVLANREYTSTLTDATVYTATQAFQNVLTVTNVGHTVSAELEDVIVTEYSLIYYYTDAFKGLTLRDVLTQIMVLSGSQWEHSESINGGGIGYAVSSKYNNSIAIKYKMSEILSSEYVGDFTPVTEITADNYFKIKNNRNDLMMVNTIKIVAKDNTEYTTNVSARVATEGEVSYTIGNLSLIVDYIKAVLLGLHFLFLYQAQQTETRIEWQGDPSIELGDDMSITDITATKKYKGYCIGNQYKFDGGLRVITRMKTLETEAL